MYSSSLAPSEMLTNVEIEMPGEECGKVIEKCEWQICMASDLYQKRERD